MAMKPTYHKIQSVFFRDPDNNHKTFLIGQYANEAFEYLAELQWVATEKIDGTNTRIHVDRAFEDGFVIGGRTDNADIHKDLATVLEDIGWRARELEYEGLTLYGEGYGAGIQKGGGAYRPDKGFILFDVMVTETGTFLERGSVKDIADKLQVPVVKTLDTLPLRRAVVRFITGDVPSKEKSGEAEGWVLRPLVELRDRRGYRVITKLKVSDFHSRLENK